MKEPVKSGSKESKTREGGALGNIDELTGDPGKGTSGATLKQSDNPDPSKGVQPKSPKEREA
ncbi:MAG TPA: hypothetical protein VF641_00890 [Methylobacterium sp.]|jgi:hypothetical protein